MKRSERLQPVQRISESREKAAVRILGQAQQHLQQQKQQLIDLKNYRNEYAQHYMQSGQAGFNGQKLQQLQNFLANIDKAIEQQHSAIENAHWQCEQAKQHWQQARGRSQALDKVAERYLSDEQTQQNRAEQKESDEYASQSGGRKRNR